MKSTLKEIARKVLIAAHLDLSKNLKYDRLTQKILRTVLKTDSNCIDVGCHKGEILDLILKDAPNGKHFAFEPIPDFFEQLKIKYKGKCKLYNCALSNEVGTTTFQYVKNAPAFSGIQKRKYEIENPEIDELTVNVDTLDNIIPENIKIDLIKIDVEGGELGVLKGAKETLLRCQPIVIFECGKGASDYYGTKPEVVFDFLTTETYLKIATLEAFVRKGDALTKEEFCKAFNNNEEYYFVAFAG